MTNTEKESEPGDRIANQKYSTYKDRDPFPEIPAALLSSADINNYIKATGMVHPFNPEDLKSASYAARIGGEVRFWTASGERKVLFLDGSTGNKSFTLKENSIAFVEVEPFLRLPSYIAVRFNLKISNVYRGLLLGTGPLVDPGFEGKIFIPLHNMTSNPFVFTHNEPLIWIEFTKTSRVLDIPSGSSGQVTRSRHHEFFPDKKKRMQLLAYLEKAVGEKSVRSSISEAIFRAEKNVNEVREQVNRIKFTAFLTAIGVGIGLIGLLVSLIALTRNYFGDVRDLENSLSPILQLEPAEKFDSQDVRISEFDDLAESLRNQVEQLSGALEDQNELIDVLNSRLDGLVEGEP